MVDGEMLEAILLGVVQGITEFLPISSDGHLVIAHALLASSSGGGTAHPESQLHFDVVLHLGTLGSILVVFRRELMGLINRPRLAGLIVAATLPAVAIGLTLKSRVEEAFNSPLAAGIGLLITAAFLLAGRRLARGEKSLDELRLADAVFIGALQALAIGPGISRSGTTIAGGLMRGLTRHTATTFSFLLAVPVISGAVVLIAKDLAMGEATVGRFDVMAVATITSFTVGLAALRGLIRLVAQDRLHWFAYYCIVAGAATIVWQCTR